MQTTIIPTFENNMPKSEIERSLVLSRFPKTYDFVFAYHSTAYFADRIPYFILLYSSEENKWKACKIEVDYHFQETCLTDNRFQKLSDLNPKKKSIESFFDFLNTNDFWTLNEDEVNRTEGINEKGELISTGFILDGSSQIFEMYAGGKYRNLSAYEPDFYQEQLAIKERTLFLKCRRKFLTLMRK